MTRAIYIQQIAGLPVYLLCNLLSDCGSVIQGEGGKDVPAGQTAFDPSV
jgi:hypothetical protein